jgi:hypothetical protein
MPRFVFLASWANLAGRSVGDHGFDELDEEVVGVVGAGAGFGVVLDGEDGARSVAQSGDGAIVEVVVADVEVGADGVGADGEAVVLAGDFDLFGEAAGLVEAPVTKFEFEGFGSEGEAEDLVAHADAEDGGGQVEEFLDGFDGLGDDGGIAGAVGEEDAVGVVAEDLVDGAVEGHDDDATAVAGEAAEDVAFDAEVEGDDGEGVLGGAIGGAAGANQAGAEFPVGFGGFGPVVGFGGADGFNEVEAFHGGGVLDEVEEFEGVEDVGGDGSVHGSAGSEAAGEGAGVDAVDAGDVVVFEVLVEGLGGSPVAGDVTEVVGDRAAYVGAVGFFVEGVDAGVAEFGVGEGDDLAQVAGVCHDFLVAGHAGVEDDFADDRVGCAEGVAAIDGAVGEDQEGGCFGSGCHIW